MKERGEKYEVGGGDGERVLEAKWKNPKLKIANYQFFLRHPRACLCDFETA